jgi:thiamine kinase-like enzyme
MTPTEEIEVRAIIADIAALQNYSGPVHRLGGLTNRVYRVGENVLRIPGAGTEEYINRSTEAASALIAAKADVSPAVRFADAKTGIMVTQHITATTMTPDNFKQRLGAPARAGMALQRLHRSGGVFPFRFELFAMIDTYLSILSTKDLALPDGYDAVVREAETIRAALAKNPSPLVPCHCDPLCENFLDNGSRMWIVDWEYCGMNDPMWDLGDLSVEGGFSHRQDLEMLYAYFGDEPPKQDYARMVIYKAMCDLLWTLWGLIQHANQNPADNFMAYALNRFQRCKRLMASSDFAGFMKLV